MRKFARYIRNEQISLGNKIFSQFHGSEQRWFETVRNATTVFSSSKLRHAPSCNVPCVRCARKEIPTFISLHAGTACCTQGCGTLACNCCHSRTCAARATFKSWTCFFFFFWVLQLYLSPCCAHDLSSTNAPGGNKSGRLTLDQKAATIKAITFCTKLSQPSFASQRCINVQSRTLQKSLFEIWVECFELW